MIGRKNVLFWILAWIPFLCGSAFGATAAFWVSPAGNDANPGTEAAPFRTLEHTIDAIRSAGDDVIVYVGDGTYRLSRTLVFDPRSFGASGREVEFRAVPGAAPVISGGMQVRGWTLFDKSRNIYRADVGANDSRQLYVDGKRAVRARTELIGGNLPAGFLPTPVLPTSGDQRPYVITGGVRFLPTDLNPAGWRDPAKWSNPRGVEAVIKTQWKMMSVPVDAVIPSSGSNPGLLVMRQPAWTNANLYLGTKSGTCDPDQPGIWSFWQVTQFENAYEFLDQPGEWYLDRAKGTIYYKPRPGEDMKTVDFELPVLEKLVEGAGTPETAVANIRFAGLTFAYATWLEPSGDQGYVADQSGFRVIGSNHLPNVTGHIQHVARTPGNLSFRYAHNISFRKNRFIHLGAVALDFGSGSQNNEIDRNTFSDISSAAIQVGDVGLADARPPTPTQATRNNTISNNLIFETGRDFVDTAAIFVGFTSGTEVSHNAISRVPWSGISIGWGWGLLDKGMYPGIPCAQSGMWGTFTTPAVNSRNTISYNRISDFLQDRWDGGAIYSTGQQGQSMNDPLVLEGNVTDHKAPLAGGNTFYTDGGSRSVLLRGNVSYSNPIGYVNLGTLPQTGAPLPYPPLALANVIPYGGDSGGCRTYGDIRYENNYWMAGIIPVQEQALDALALLLSKLLKISPSIDPYTKEGFFKPCPLTLDNVSYPVNLTYAGNHDIAGVWDVPKAILDAAGVQP
jgi:hypothetical protein